jgi:hypothetical protein
VPASTGVACATGADCSAGRFCAAGVCYALTPVCQDDSDCEAGQACGAGLCVACLPPKDPTQPSKYCTDEDKPLCFFDPANPAAASCGNCLSDAECAERGDGNTRCAAVPFPANAPPFGTAEAQGVEYMCSCETNAQCTVTGKSLCRAEGCVCSDNRGCADNEACVAGACVACQRDSDCAGKPDDGDPATLPKTQCIGEGTTAAKCGCSDHSECEPDAAGNATYCHEDSGTCIPCSKDDHCGNGGKCINGGKPEAECACENDGQCEDDKKCFGPGAAGAYCGCTTNDNCVDDPAGPICNKETGVCAECATNSHCAESPAGAICDTATGTCTGCVMDTDCVEQKLGSVCVEGSCSCAAGGECAAPNSSAALTWVCE